ncbi:MAG TPA: hypothetical protein VJQ54_24735 [Candidatus Sulfotelmatobacter sp.]|nr:hypothetical protein [Candidatus Sulfotelmatobacter sp.]
MKNANRSRIVRVLAFWAVFLFAVTSSAQQRDPIIENIAKAYGLDSYDKIEAIRYNWNLEIPGVLKLAHKWEWEPKTGKISFESTDKSGKPVKVTYESSQLNSQPDQVKNEVEPAFVNDNYWLIFPFHAYWDKSATITNQGMTKLPIGAGSATLVSVKYPTEAGGYTPGDTWDLYVSKDHRVQAMVYHRGGDKKPTLVTTTWTGYKKAGPLLVSTEHRGKADDKPLHLWITDVAVKVTGSDKWIAAQ